MDFTDEGIFISAKPLGEANAVAEILTAAHGRHLGLVRGGRSRRLRPLLQPGNLLSLSWRARLADHLGGFAVELIDPLAARVLDDQAALSAIGSLTSSRQAPARARPASRALSRRASGPARARRCRPLARAPRALGDDAAPGSRLRPRFERLRRHRRRDRPRLRLAALGPRRVAPRRRSLWRPAAQAAAVSASRRRRKPRLKTWSQGFALTGHFLERHVLAPHGQSLPQSRERLIGLLATPEASP